MGPDIGCGRDGVGQHKHSKDVIGGQREASRMIEALIEASSQLPRTNIVAASTLDNEVESVCREPTRDGIGSHYEAATSFSGEL